jgi:hypothetical protein
MMQARTFPVSISAGLGAEAASFQLNNSSASTVTTECHEILAVIAKGDAADLAEYVDGLSGSVGLGVDNVDIICLLGSN